MKKSKMMRLASCLLVLTLLTTCMISGTFAKYVTADDATDKARVAKWGVTVEAENNTLFTTDYKTDDATYSGTYSVSSSASDRDDVVAPGTSGTVTSIAISGIPEVAVDVAVVPEIIMSDNWMVGGDFYCPLTIKVGATSFYGLDYPDKDAFITAIEDAIKAYSAKYEPNTDLSTITNGTAFDISWAWAFEGTDGMQTDVKDTALGNAAVGADLEFQMDLDITVTQID